MNHTRMELTNQRIARITAEHAIVGIDIAKDMHVAQVVDFRGITLAQRALPFPNTQAGFQKLRDWIQAICAKHGKASYLVGMEPTGHYWFNLANMLVEQGVAVMLVNPMTTHRNKENRDNSPSKNDAKDALVIAESVSRGFYSEYEPLSPTYDRLKTLMSDREYWVNQQASLGNRIVRWIDLYFPEFRQVFKEWDGVRALATLRAFPLPQTLRKLTEDEVIKGWQEQGMKRAAGGSGKAKAVQLLQAAALSIGKRGTESEAQRDLKRLVSTYDTTTQVLQEMAEEVEVLLGELPLVGRIRSIQGLGSVAIASIFSYAGDLRHYAHGNQLLRRAGLNLAERTSGRHKGQIKLSKRGDSTLRKHLFLAVLSLVRQHPDFKRWHAHQVARGMTRMKSILKLVGKLCRILVGMVQRGEDYRSPGMAAAA